MNAQKIDAREPRAKTYFSFIGKYCIFYAFASLFAGKYNVIFIPKDLVSESLSKTHLSSHRHPLVMIVRTQIGVYISDRSERESHNSVEIYIFM